MRPISDYLRQLPRAHRYLYWFARAAILFRHPVPFLLHYIRRTSPSDRAVDMRDGTHIHLSSHAHDIVTLFVVLVREDYGRVPRGSTVVDIGANLGVFALYAARCGAGAVYAYEPNDAAYQCLTRNIEANALSSIVHPRQLAVAATAGQVVKFPRPPSPYNRIAGENENGEFESVRTTSLAEIMANDTTGEIDLLKLDCEGAEYEILFTAAPADLQRIAEIRIEYHRGRDAEIKAHLHKAGFEITFFHSDDADTGLIWARRAAPRA